MLFILLGPQIWAIVSDNLSVDHFRPVVKGILNIFFGSLKNFLELPFPYQKGRINRGLPCKDPMQARRVCSRQSQQSQSITHTGDIVP